ncbi:2-amino-4-hydroxy-6-hydroxymethyldihydropteridinediphosphokinase [soil metagenome]
MVRLTPVLLSFGSNLGESASSLVRAFQKLANQLEVEALSSLYRSQPVGCATQPDFLNLACAGETQHSPETILGEIQRIEYALGRVRSLPNAPRTIDIDLLAYGDLVLDTPELILPHPRLHQRAFVLVPLSEIAPAWRHPVFGKTAAELLSAAGPLERIECVGPLPHS